MPIYYAGNAELTPLAQVWPADPTTISLVVTDPAGVATTYTYAAAEITRADTGSYAKSVPCTVAGRWTGVWTAAGAVSDIAEQVWSVEPTGGPLVGLDEAKLQLSSTVTANDDQFRFLLEVASQEAEDYCGRAWRSATFTESYDGGQEGIALRHQPIGTVSSVVENGTTLTTDSWFTNTSAGIIYRGQPQWQFRWLNGRQNIVITYTAGPVAGIVPSPIRQGVKVLIAHLWDTQRGGATMPRQLGAEQVWDMRRGFTLPNAVREHWDFYRASSF